MAAKRALACVALLAIAVANPVCAAPLVSLSGVVRDAYGTAVDRAYIEVNNGSTYAWTKTDGVGHYALQVAAGNNTLTLATGDGPLNPARVPPSYGVSVPIALSTDTVQDLTLPRVIDIEAHVTVAGGAPVEGVFVYSVNQDAMAPFELFPGGSATGRNEVSRGHTDASGIVHLTCFPTLTIERLYADYQSSPSAPVLRDIRDNVVALDNITVQFQLDALTATLLSATTELHPGLVRIRWYASACAGQQVRIERCDSDKTWRKLSQGVFDWSGTLLFEDASVGPAASYGYRVSSGVGDEERTQGEVWVTTLGKAGPKLEVLTNPSFDGTVRVSFQLPSESTGTVELLDLAGRVVLGTRVNPTESTVGLRPNPARPGIYFVRLRQGMFEMVRKVVVASR